MGTTQRGATLEGEPLLCAAGAGIDAIISQTPYSYASPDLRPRYLALHASVFVGFFYIVTARLSTKSLDTQHRRERSLRERTSIRES